MTQNSKIEWTHHTANLWWGCTKVHAGCDNCYAEAWANRFNINVWGKENPRQVIKSVWNDLAKYQKLAHEAGEVHRVFVGSMMDIFETPVRLVDSKGRSVQLGLSTGIVPGTTAEMRRVLFNNIWKENFGLYPNLMFLFLTKRPSNINRMIPEGWRKNPPDNVMFGTSVVDQKTADRLIPQLLQVNGKRFLSIEPQLDHIHLRMEWIKAFPDTGIHWVINGGESGANRRPFNLDWARSLKSQCESRGIPYFFKQIDKVIDKATGIPEDLQIREFPR